MRRILVTAIAAIALLAPASAFAADHPLTQAADGSFDQHSILIRPGDSVTLTNQELVFGGGIQYADESSPRCVAPTYVNCARSDFPSNGQVKYWDPETCTTGYDDAGCDDAHRGIVSVDVDPVASGLMGPGSGKRGDTLPFSATGSDSGGDAIVKFNWTWGDGSSESTSGGSATHAYATAGDKTVSVTVTDSNGNTSAAISITVTITIPDTDGDGVNDDVDECDDVAASTANGCPPPPIVTPLAAFNSSAVAATILGQGGVVKSGVTLVVNCSEPCTAVVTLLRGTATVGTKTVALATAGSQLVTVPISAGAKRSLAKAKNPKLTVRVGVTDAHGRVATLSKTIQLKAVKSVGKLPAIGISDQQPRTFSDPFFQILRLRYARLVTPWNSVFTEKDRLDGWLREARAHGVRPLVSFEHARGQVCPGKHCKGPTAGQYKKAWRAFHKKYPWVKDISPWNEANSATQPTGKKPQSAAAYYNIVRTSCRGCQIVAADLLDTNNLRRYLVAFLANAKGKPRLWGLHNYRDTNRFRETGTRTLLRYVKGKVWFTETGGIVRFETQDGTVALPKSEKRAKRAMDYMFKLAEKYASRVKRVYVYQWRINFTGDRFDAGVVRDDGSPRPSFQVLTLNASVARKR